MQQGILDLSAYNLPQSESIGVRIQENLSQYGFRYGQVLFVIIAIGGFSQLTLLLALIATYVGWNIIMRNPDVLSIIPNGGFIDTQDKKLIILLLFNIAAILALAGTDILSYVGMGCVIIILHAALWKSPSTLPITVQQDFDRVLLQNDENELVVKPQEQ